MGVAKVKSDGKLHAGSYYVRARTLLGHVDVKYDVCAGGWTGGVGFSPPPRRGAQSWEFARLTNPGAKYGVT